MPRVQRTWRGDETVCAGRPDVCEWPGCSCAAEFPAPRSRRELRRFFWFCIDHVRQYNATWNYYAGMTDVEVEADLRFDAVWQRPSWRLGENCAAYAFRPRLEGEPELGGANDARPRSSDRSRDDWALTVLDLRPPLTIAIVKARYKQLVKRHHPDTNGGDKAAEERFKQISEAYRLVMSRLAS